MEQLQSSDYDMRSVTGFSQDQMTCLSEPIIANDLGKEPLSASRCRISVSEDPHNPKIDNMPKFLGNSALYPILANCSLAVATFCPVSILDP